MASMADCRRGGAVHEGERCRFSAGLGRHDRGMAANVVGFLFERLGENAPDAAGRSPVRSQDRTVRSLPDRR